MDWHGHVHIQRYWNDGEMDRLDTMYQSAVDQEIDRLARLSPSQLMQLHPKRWKVTTEQGVIELAYLIADCADHRRIAVMAERPVLLGIGTREFGGAPKVLLRSERLSSAQVAAL